MLFAHRAACSNPALALRMRNGAALWGAMMRSGQQMQWLEGMWWRKRRPACEDGGRYAVIIPVGVVAQSAIYVVRANGSIEEDNFQTSLGRRQGCMRSIAGL